MFWVLLFVGSLLYLVWPMAKKRRSGLPPGPWFQLPIIGHPQALGDPQDVGMRLQKKYGDVVYFNSLGMNQCFLMSYEAMEEVLNNTDAHYRMPDDLMPTLSELFSDLLVHGRHGIATTSGPEWQEQRRFTLRTLRDFGFGKSSMEELILNEFKEFAALLRKEAEAGPLDLSNKFNIMSINVLWTITAGKRFDYEDEELKQIVKKLTECFKALGPTPSLILLILFPKLRKWAPGLLGWSKVKEGYHGIYNVVKTQIENHLKDLNPDEPPRDFIDAYLLEMRRIEAEGKTNSSFYKEVGTDSLFCVLHDLFMAGSETTSTSLQWAVLHLVRRPDVQSKMQDELDTVVGRERLPTLQDQTQLPYCQAAIEEIYRISSLSGVANQRYCNRDVKVQNFIIPRGTVVVPHHWSVHRGTNSWEDPQQFKPERHLDSEGKFHRSERVIPFSIGKRRCPGETLARSEVFLITTGLVHIFNFRAAEGEEVPSMDYKQGVILYPKPHKVLLTPRDFTIG